MGFSEEGNATMKIHQVNTGANQKSSQWPNLEQSEQQNV